MRLVNALRPLLALTLVGATALAAQTAGPLPRTSPERQGISSAAILDFVQAADTGVDAMNGFMLVRHGSVVAEGWWAPYAPAMPHVLYSLSKSFTSTAVGLAVAEGKLSLDDEVLKFFREDAPAQPSANLRQMRVRDLLRMNTGHQTEPTFWIADPATDTLLQNVTRKVNLKPGKAKNFKFKFNYPETLPEGNYFILGVVDTADSVGESNEQNNVAASPTQVTIAPPFIDAVGTFADPAPTSLTVGRRGQAILVVQNAGNVPLRGRPVIRLVLSSDGTVDGADSELAMPAVGLNLKPGRAKRVRLRFETPAVTPGPFFLIANIDQTNVLTERNEANNTVSTAVTVASA